MRNLEEIRGKAVHIRANADDKGHLFSGIHKKELVEAMQKEHNVQLSEESIILDKPIKQAGESEIHILIKGEKSSFKLIIEKI